MSKKEIKLNKKKKKKWKGEKNGKGKGITVPGLTDKCERGWYVVECPFCCKIELKTADRKKMKCKQTFLALQD